MTSCLGASLRVSAPRCRLLHACARSPPAPAAAAVRRAADCSLSALLPRQQLALLPLRATCAWPSVRRRVRQRCPPVAALAFAFVDAAFVCTTAYCVSLFGVMLLPPAPWRRAVVANLWTYAPLAVLYLCLLCLSWQPDTLSLMLPGSLEEGMRTGAPQFFPQLACIIELLQRRVTAASAWAHLLAVNAFLGRHIYLDGARCRVGVAHSLLLSLFAGPAGLASHLATKALVLGVRKMARGKRRQAAVVS